jgi:hypothetical protein
MSHRRKRQISSRKQPRQARSTELVAVILEAVVRVLEKEGAQRFTTARVAERILCEPLRVGPYKEGPKERLFPSEISSENWKCY